MQVMVTLPDVLVSNLISQAKSKNLTFNEFLLQTLQNDPLTPLELQEYARDAANGNHSELDRERSTDLCATSPFYFVEEETLTDVIRRIQARPPNLANIHPATKTVDELIHDLEENPPETSEFSPDEWNQMWAEFECGMKLSAREKAVSAGQFEQ